MVVPTICCLNLSPPPPAAPNQSSPPSRTSQVSFWPQKERTWTSKCALGMACMLISLEMGNSNSMDYKGVAIAGDIQLITQSNERVNKWSDKRMCPPWQLNSLETIVPENLPRPSAPRKWEGVDYSTSAPPAIKVIVVKPNSNCFSM